jgi:hypothetical protein
MYPHERSLVKRLEGKPFALIGVNSDDSREEAKKPNLTWRSFYGGPGGGKIAQQYKVRSWPSIFVLDARGVIRFKDKRGEALDEAVDQLLAEMK